MAEADRTPWRIERYEEIDSTQEELRRRLMAGEPIAGLVIRAGSQTQGQGRRADVWSSGPGGSYQSLAVGDGSGVLRDATVPLALAVAIAEALGEAGIEVALKWPNDLHLWRPTEVAAPMPRLPGKVGGILCQHLRNHLLVGIGINVRNEVPAGCASLPGLEPEEVSDLVLAAVAAGLATVDEPRLPERWRRFDPLHGRMVRVKSVGNELLGRYEGVNRQGCLLLLTTTGMLEMCDGRIVEIDAAVSG